MNQFIHRNMVNSGNTAFRTEQMRAGDILFDIFNKKVEKEKRITKLTIDGFSTNDAIPDLMIRDLKLVFRLNGGIHTNSASRRNKDNNQKDALEEAGWNVIDFWEDQMKNLWTKNKYTDEVKEKAKNEIIKVLKKNGVNLGIH